MTEFSDLEKFKSFIRKYECKKHHDTSSRQKQFLLWKLHLKCITVHQRTDTFFMKQQEIFMHSSVTVPHMRRRVDLKSCREMWYIIYSGHFSKHFRQVNRVGWNDKLRAISFMEIWKGIGLTLKFFLQRPRPF